MKGEKEGNYYKMKRGSVKYSGFKKYADKKVLGENCMVFSYTYKSAGKKHTCYKFVSRKTGLLKKDITIYPDTIFTIILFESKLTNKSASFFKKPKKVKFEKK